MWTFLSINSWALPTRSTYIILCLLCRLAINKINKILTIVLEENKTLRNYKEKLSLQKNMAFTSYNKPTLSIKDYLYRIQSYSEAEDNTIIIGLL